MRYSIVFQVKPNFRTICAEQATAADRHTGRGLSEFNGPSRLGRPLSFDIRRGSPVCLQTRVYRRQNGTTPTPTRQHQI